MKALAILAFLLGVIAIMNWRQAGPQNEPRATAVAANYVQFRQSVLHHVFAQGHAEAGEIDAELDLPPGWSPIRPWMARIETGHCYVWGEVSWAELREIRTLLHGSYATGHAENGRLVPGYDAVIALPDFVPSGNVVSVFSLQ